MKEDSLTEKQRVLAAQNHNLIYAYAHKNNILIGDYYDILAIGLCKAAKTYDETKSKFSTYAYKCMRNELYANWNSTKKESAIPEHIVVSYDALKRHGDSDNQSYSLEFIEDSQPYDNMMYDIMCTEFADRLSEKERKIFFYLAAGFRQTDIAHELGCSQQVVSYHVKQIRKRVISYLG